MATGRYCQVKWEDETRARFDGNVPYASRSHRSYAFGGEDGWVLPSHSLKDRDYDKIQIVTIKKILENCRKRLDIPLSEKAIVLPPCDCGQCTDGYCGGCLDPTCDDPGCVSDPANRGPPRDLLAEQVQLVAPWPERSGFLNHPWVALQWDVRLAVATSLWRRKQMPNTVHDLAELAQEALEDEESPDDLREMIRGAMGWST